VIGFAGPSGDADLQRVSDLARRLRFSIYDAVYLDLAQLHSFAMPHLPVAMAD